MHVLVVGAGIIGSIYGWALTESGHKVVHLVRSGRAAGLRERHGDGHIFLDFQKSEIGRKPFTAFGFSNTVAKSPTSIEGLPVSLPNKTHLAKSTA
jgi:ketopantoate reductase